MDTNKVETSIDFDLLLADCIQFTKSLIQTPSMPGEEKAITDLLVEKIREMELDDLWIDEIGNVNARLNGTNRDSGAIVLNSHLDHVDPGDITLWRHSPYAAEIDNNRIYGRGACDIKGPLAVQLFAMFALKKAGLRPGRDVVFTGVVEEEVGGTGASHWAKKVDYPLSLIILGEPSSNQICLGHRGIHEIWVTFLGRSVHASVSKAESNPNYSLARFLTRAHSLEDSLGSHPLLGRTTVAPTIIEVDTKSMNVTPAWTRVLLDIRTAAESSRSISDWIASAAEGFEYRIDDALERMATRDPEEVIIGFVTDPDLPVVQKARTLLAQGMGRKAELTHYQFATDGRFFTELGVPIIGYSPAEESQAHIADESIDIALMGEALKGYVNLLLNF